MRRFCWVVFAAGILGLLGCGRGAEVEGTAVPLPTSSPVPTATAVSLPTPTISPDDVVTFVIDPAGSTAVYRVEERFLTGGIDFGDARTEGETSAISGQLQLVLNQPPQLAGGELQVDLRTLVSGNELRDAAIRERWLASDRYPFARFALREIVAFPTSWQAGEAVEFALVGDMTIREVTQPLTFDVSATLTDGQLTGVATSYLLMEDYGFEPPFLPGIVQVTDGVTVTVQFVAVALE